MLKIGIIGAGHMGRIHLRLLAQMKDVELVGIYDINRTNSVALANEYGIPAPETFEALIKESDAVIIASPTATHFQYASAALKNGNHVFIEKPVCANTLEAGELIALNLSYNRIVQVNMVERFNPALGTILPFVQKPIKSFHNRLAPFTPRGADVSVVMDVMIHDLDLILSMAGGINYTVKAHGEKIITDKWDVVNAIIQFENGWTCYLTASRVAERKYRQTLITMEDKTYKVDMLNNQCFYAATNQVYMENESKSGISVWTEMPIKSTNAIEEGLKSFISSVLNNKKVVVSLQDGMQCMKLAEAIEGCMNQQ